MTADQEKGRARQTLRWGIVGTGMIANELAAMIQQAAHAELVAVASRRQETAEVFARRHAIPHAFGSWAEMAAREGIDAIYVATPTSVREVMCIEFANNGKHVLAEKPFASLPSLRRISAACRRNDVGFMDGTHFVHHPRTRRISAEAAERAGRIRHLASAFHVSIKDRSNIRFDPALEPLGAIGDLGWYNMRAAVEFLAPDIEIVSAGANLRRDGESGAVIAGSGTVLFSDGSTTTWSCSSASGAVVMDLRIAGEEGTISLDDFVHNRPGLPAGFERRQGGFGADGSTERIAVPADKPAAALMFENFADMVGSVEERQACQRSSERTQALVDTIWHAALADEAR